MKRVCACGCGESMEGRRSEARYASAACRTRDWKRREGIVGIRYRKVSQNGKGKPSGRQQSHLKSIGLCEEAIETARAHPESDARRLAELYMTQALPARQRDQRQAQAQEAA